MAFELYPMKVYRLSLSKTNGELIISMRGHVWWSPGSPSMYAAWLGSGLGASQSTTAGLAQAHIQSNYMLACMPSPTDAKESDCRLLSSGYSASGSLLAVKLGTKGNRHHARGPIGTAVPAMSDSQPLTQWMYLLCTWMTVELITDPVA